MTYRETEIPVVTPARIRDTTYDALRVLESALAIQIKRGWTRGIWEDRQGRVCILGAVNHGAAQVLGCPITDGHVNPGNGYDREVITTAVKAISDVIKADDDGEYVSHIWSWNDRVTHAPIGAYRSRRAIRRAIRALSRI